MNHTGYSITVDLDEWDAAYDFLDELRAEFYRGRRDIGIHVTVLKNLKPSTDIDTLKSNLHTVASWTPPFDLSLQDIEMTPCRAPSTGHYISMPITSRYLHRIRRQLDPQYVPFIL